MGINISEFSEALNKNEEDVRIALKKISDLFLKGKMRL